jgi:hypothetical protein
MDSKIIKQGSDRTMKDTTQIHDIPPSLHIFNFISTSHIRPCSHRESPSQSGESGSNLIVCFWFPMLSATAKGYMIHQVSVSSNNPNRSGG